MRGYRFDENGNIVPIKVYIVWGPPASGKTTYVRKHMQPGDLVVDLDLIKQAISMCGKTEAPDTLLPTALSIREHIYGLIERREIDCQTVWVVAGLPRADEREALARRLGAELIRIEATEQECLERAMADAERTDKAKQRWVIERWFREFYAEAADE